MQIELHKGQVFKWIWPLTWYLSSAIAVMDMVETYKKYPINKKFNQNQAVSSHKNAYSLQHTDTLTDQ